MSGMPNCLFSTSRLALRRILPPDADFLESLFCDAAMMRHVGGVWTSDAVNETLLEWQEAWTSGRYCYGIAETQANGEKVGLAGISEDTNEFESGVELSWFISPRYQGRGYAAELTSGLMAYAFESLGTERLFAETAPENQSAIRVLSRLGFVCQGVQSRKYDFLPGMTSQEVWDYRKDAWLSGGRETLLSGVKLYSA